jgi:glutaredoxin 2
VTLHDIHKNNDDRRTLLAVGGKEQVPCLFIDGEPLYESLDIIAWLEAHPQA